MIGKQNFPHGFLWGSATSAYQIEGGIENDWSEAARQGKIPITGKACDSYDKYEEDFEIAKSLGQNAHRFSLEWSRIEPEEGKFDETAIDHYRKVIKAIRDRGMEPFVTIWHFTLPVWFANIGGFENPKASFYFARYCDYVLRSLGDKAKFWITMNEPMVYVVQGYWNKKWPPFKKNFSKFLKVTENLIVSHNLAYQRIKLARPEVQVGIAKNNKCFEHNWNPFNFFLAIISKWFWNYRFLNRISDFQDFIGLNYYFSIKFGGKKTEQKTDMGWPIYPAGLYKVIKELNKYGKPIYITENGLADARDSKRESFIKDHLYFIQQAITKKVDVRGYFHWSLLDNYEWAHGFEPKFGLVEVDFQTLERKIRPSAYKFKEICETNSL